MRRNLLCLFVISILSSLSASANYTTPGTSVRFSLDDLVANANGDVVFSAGSFLINDTITISVNDTLDITTDVTVRFAAGTFFEILGTIIVNPPTGVLFTAQNAATGYLGMRFTSSPASVLRKLTFEYAVSLRISDCSIVIDSCTFRYNNNSTSTTFGNGAIALFRSSSVITNSKFLNNQRAAIQGGANIANAPKIINCLFMDNNTTNQNVPQINLGASGTADTTKIIGNQILRASTRSGGIGFLPVGDVYAVISGNTIKNNRYGITLNGGSNIRALISYNTIDSNNTEGNPLAGGSGIAFSGGSATSHQAVIVTGNYIRWNLWGITVGPTSTGGGALPNLGNLANADTTDDGKNWIYGNNNTSTPNIDLYNNNVDNLMAQGNYWGSDDPALIEARIFHKVDNVSLGLVDFSSYVNLPVELVSFSAGITGNDVLLTWQTVSETNTSHFIVERSDDGLFFYTIGQVAAAGNSSEEKNYNHTERNRRTAKQFYRLKVVDNDGRYHYSKVLVVRSQNDQKNSLAVYPTMFSGAQPLTVQIVSDHVRQVIIQFVSVDGKVLQQVSKNVMAGVNSFSIVPETRVPKGLVFVRCMGTEQLIKLFKE